MEGVISGFPDLRDGEIVALCDPGVATVFRSSLSPQGYPMRHVVRVVSKPVDRYQSVSTRPPRVKALANITRTDTYHEIQVDQL